MEQDAFECLVSRLTRDLSRRSLGIIFAAALSQVPPASAKKRKKGKKKKKSSPHETPPTTRPPHGTTTPAPQPETYTNVLTWGVQGSDPGQLDTPWGLGIDEHDHLYVAEAQNRRVSKFSNTGAFIATGDVVRANRVDWLGWGDGDPMIPSPLWSSNPV